MKSTTQADAASGFQFAGRMSKEILRSFASRAITHQGLCVVGTSPDPIFEEDLRMVCNMGAKYIGRAVLLVKRHIRTGRPGRMGEMWKLTLRERLPVNASVRPEARPALVPGVVQHVDECVGGLVLVAVALALAVLTRDSVRVATGQVMATELSCCKSHPVIQSFS